MMSKFNYFVKIRNLKFNAHLMRAALRKILKIQVFDDGGGEVKYISGISLNRIPNDKKSTKGKNVWGRYWTKPNHTSKEVERADFIDEEAYKEFIEDFKETYFEYIYNVLSKRYQLGRVRILKKEPRSTLSWHRDPEPRLHIPIITNPGCRMVIENHALHMPADGGVWIVDATKYHNAFNGGEEDRIHIVATLPRFKFQ
jgi:hypothetical protein